MNRSPVQWNRSTWGTWHERNVNVTARIVRAMLVALVITLLGTPVVVAQSDDAPSDEAELRFADVEVSPEDPTTGSVAQVQFRVENGDGEPVSGLRASGVLRAPSTAQDDTPPQPAVTAIGRETEEPGRYEVAVALNESGRWWIEVRVDDGNGRVARHDHFTVVDSSENISPATTSDPIFLRGNQWDAYYRVDPDTGSVATLDGEELFNANDSWWLASTETTSLGVVSREYGGTWQMRVHLRDGITGEDISTINLGEVRANVFNGSFNDPAIATSVIIAPDASAAYIYWARQLGKGWVSYVAEADPYTGEVLNQRIVNGAISSNGFWAELYLVNGEHLTVAEQVVEGASVSGYRLTMMERGSLDILHQYRRTDAEDDPITHCMLAYPGPVGKINDIEERRYSLCSPPDVETDRALVIWDQVTGEPVHTIDLSGISGSEGEYTDGVASPDDTIFYAINTRTVRIAEIDMASGEVLRERSLLPNDDGDPSTWDRFFDWVFGGVSNTAAAAGSVEPSVAISPDGDTLYVVARPENREPGVLVIDLENLEIVNSLMTGTSIEGLVATDNDRIAVIERESSSDGDSVTVVDNEGNELLTFTLPGRSDIIGSNR